MDGGPGGWSLLLKRQKKIELLCTCTKLQKLSNFLAIITLFRQQRRISSTSNALFSKVEQLLRVVATAIRGGAKIETREGMRG